MPPVLPTERIAHLGTADCCIHPPGRNEMIAITPPKIFSKEVAQKQATPLPRQNLPQHQKSFYAKFPGMGSGRKFETEKSPYRGVPNRGSAARQNEVGLAGSRRRLMSRTRPGASILHCGHGALHAAALPLRLCKKCA